MKLVWCLSFSIFGALTAQAAEPNFAPPIIHGRGHATRAGATDAPATIAPRAQSAPDGASPIATKASEASTDIPNETPQVEKPVVSNVDNTPTRVTTRFYAQLDLSYTRFDSVDSVTGGSASILSGLDKGLDLAWQERLTKQFQTTLHFRLVQIDMLETPDRTIKNNPDTYSELTVAGDWLFTNDFSLGLTLGLRQSMTVRTRSTTELFFQKMMLPRISVGARYWLWQSSRFALGIKADGGLSAPASVDEFRVQLGRFARGELQLIRKLGIFDLSGGLFYETQLYDSNFATQTRTDTGIVMGISIPYSN